MLLGLAAGFWGGYTDTIISRLIDSTLAFPSLLLAIAVAFFIGPGYLTLLISLTIVSWAPIARLVRSAVLTVKSESYIEAARAVNASQLRILFTHILPNCRSVIIIAFTSGIAAAIIGESSLSFLGLGPDPSIPTWGQMISTGMKDLFAPPPNHPWLYLFPGFFLFMTVLAFNMAGDLLRDSLDPRFRSQR
jgi:ABC-type dipeptide/oligopeptide/nickel transport system permease subunit